MVYLNPRAVRDTDVRTPTNHSPVTRPATKSFPTKSVRIAVRELREYAKTLVVRTGNAHKIIVSSNRYTRSEVEDKVRELFEVVSQRDMPKSNRSFHIEFIVKPR